MPIKDCSKTSSADQPNIAAAPGGQLPRVQFQTALALRRMQLAMVAIDLLELDPNLGFTLGSDRGCWQGMPLGLLFASRLL
jgi:hypothetical protein